MGEAKPASFYDECYRTDPNLTADADASTFGPLWREMARRVPDGARVVEIGCGAGQLGAMIAERCRSYVGFDSSAVAVAEARKRIASSRVAFGLGVDVASAEIVVATIGNGGSGRWCDGGLVIACEVFEHLERGVDLDALSAFRGARVLFSLPTRDSESHVRHFPTEASVRERYEPRVEGMTVEAFDQWWIVEGRAR